MGQTSILACWLAAVGIGLASVTLYQVTPSPKCSVAERWPGESIIPDTKDKRVLLFAHPHCPCTRASLRMLDGVLQRDQTRQQQETSVRVVLVRPNGCGDEWDEGPVRRTAEQLGFTVASIDEGEAKRFGASTSGEVFAYDEGGELRFHGGITLGRGHEGSNSGAEALYQFLNKPDGFVETPLFGCPLIQPGHERFHDTRKGAGRNV